MTGNRLQIRTERTASFRAHNRRPASARPAALPCPATQNDQKPPSPACRATPALSCPSPIAIPSLNHGT
jgi:hypothetical protein